MWISRLDQLEPVPVWAWVLRDWISVLSGFLFLIHCTWSFCCSTSRVVTLYLYICSGVILMSQKVTETPSVNKQHALYENRDAWCCWSSIRWFLPQWHSHTFTDSKQKSNRGVTAPPGTCIVKEVWLKVFPETCTSLVDTVIELCWGRLIGTEQAAPSIDLKGFHPVKRIVHCSWHVCFSPADLS